MLRGRIGVLLLSVTWIAITTPSPTDRHNVRPTRQLDFGECCPCTGNTARADAGKLADTELDAVPDSSAVAAVLVSSVGRSAGECPCCQRDADSVGAASGSIPGQVRAAGPFVMLRPSDSREEGKPLLHPEVGLASSVLETLREATDEEYKDALERDAARSAAAEDNSSEASRNIVTIILNPTTQSTEKVDDSDAAGTHILESRFIHSPLESSKTVSQLEASQNMLEDKVGIPRFQPSGLSMGKLLLFDDKTAASEVRNTFIGTPAQSAKPPLLKLLPDDKLHLDKRGVRDLIKVYRMSKDMLDENETVKTSELTSKDGVSSGTIPDFGINSKISDLNERIDQLNDLNELTKIPKLKIDGKYSKVAKGVEILEDSEEMTNAESLQAPSDREDTASPASDIQRSDVPDFQVAANPDKTSNEAIIKSVPDLVTTAKNLLKLKDVELIPSKDAAAKASQTNIPNLKLLTLDDLISRAKAINLRDLIPAATVTSTTPGPVTDPDFANDVASDFTNVRGHISKYDFDYSPQEFETEIIDAAPSPSVNQATIAKSAGEGRARASADASKHKAVLNEKTFEEPQIKSVVGNNEEIMNQEFKESNENVARQGHFSTESDDDSEPESSENADRSLDVDRNKGLKLADKLERLSDKLKKSEHNSKCIDIDKINTKETKDAEVAESRNSDAIKSPQNEFGNNVNQGSYLLNGSRPSGNSQAVNSPREQLSLGSDVRSATPKEELTKSSLQEKTKTAMDNIADQPLNVAGDICNTIVERKDGKLQTSKNAEMAKEASKLTSLKNHFKAKPRRPNTIPHKPTLQAKSKEYKNGLAKKADMTAAASDRALNFLDSRRQIAPKPKLLSNIFNSESNLQAPGPWTLWSGLEHDRINKYPHLSPEKFRDLFEGLSRARVNDGMYGGEHPAFAERRSQSRLKLPFREENVPMRSFPLSVNEVMSSVGAPALLERMESPRLNSLFKTEKEATRPFLLSGMNIGEMAPEIPSLDDMRSRVQEYLNSQKLRDSGSHNLGNLRGSEPLKQLEDFRDNLQKNAASAVSNLQQTLSSTLDVAKVRDENFLANSIYTQPENVLDALSKARFDVDDRLKSIHTSVMDRLSSINDQLSMDPPPFPKGPNLKSAGMQEKSASENRLRITSPKTPTQRLRSGKMVVRPVSQGRLSGPSAVKEPIRLPSLSKLDLSQLPYLPWEKDGKLSSTHNEKSLKSSIARKPNIAEKPEQDLSEKALPIVRKSMRKPAERTRERTSTTSQRNTAPRPDLRVRPLQPTPEIRRTQIKRPSKTSPETRKWKMALATTPSPRTSIVSRTSTPLLKSSLDENANPLAKFTFDPRERLRASLKSQRDSLGSSSQNIMLKTDAINERLKNNLALHRQKAQENVKSRGTILKPVVKVNISKMELPERTAFKDPPTGKLQKRDSETEEDELGEAEKLLVVKPLGKATNVNDFLDKLKQSVSTTLSSAGLKPKLANNEAGKLQLRPEMMEGASDVFKSMIEKANEPMKENMSYQCKMVCNKE